MNRTLPFLVLLLLALPATAQGEEPVASLTVRTLEWEGTTSMDGDLAAFRSVPPASGGGPLGAPTAPPRAAPDMTLQGSFVRLAVDHYDTNTSVAGTGVGEPWSEEASFANATATFQAGPGVRFFVTSVPGAPEPRVSLRAASATLERAEGDLVQERLVPSDRPMLGAPGSGAALMRASDGWQEVTITGSFQMTVWDWDLRIASEEGTALVATGSHEGPFLGPAKSRHEAQAYLVVLDGRLTATVRHAVEAELYLQPEALRVEGTLRANGSQGTLATPEGDLPVRSDVVLEGDFDARFGAITGRVPLLVYGDADRAQVGDTLLPMARVASTAAAWPWAAAIVAPLAFLPVATRRRRMTLRTRCELWMERGEYERVLEHGKPLLRSRRHRGDAVVMHLVSLLRLDRVDEASRLASRHTGRDAPAGADYVRAHIHGVRREWDQARAALQECLRKDPAMRQEAVSNPVFTPILRSLRLAETVEGYG